MYIYGQWLSDDGKSIAKHTLKEWIEILNIKPELVKYENKVTPLQTYTTTAAEYAKYGFIDIYWNGYGIIHSELKNHLTDIFYAVNADIGYISLRNVRN